MPKLIRVCELVRHWLECSTDTEMQPHDSNSHTRFSSYLAFSKNTTSPRAGVLCRALSPDQPRRPVTDSFILLMNHLCAPPRPAFTHTRASVDGFVLRPGRLAARLAAWRKTSGDFCLGFIGGDAAGRSHTWPPQNHHLCGWNHLSYLCSQIVLPIYC